ncbi:MAG: glycosyltransferase family 2 protein [Victivallaceae bacterium]|nr:glycosyltransferase family 2 protein [Victivallaceae bacterium]
MKLSIVIPAYNEAIRILDTLVEIKCYLECQQDYCSDYEIIVVSDGSTDDTDQVVLDLTKDFSGLKLITYPDNRGKGFAVKTGIQASDSDLVLFADADGATPIKELNKLLEPILTDRADMVIASRRVIGANIIKEQPILRIFVGKVFSFINIIMLNMPYIDTQCGFKLFKGELARKLFNDKISDGFAFDVEILFYATRAKYRIKEQGVTWNDSSDSKVSPFKDGMKMLGCVLRLVWHERIISPIYRFFVKKSYRWEGI